MLPKSKANRWKELRDSGHRAGASIGGGDFVTPCAAEGGGGEVRHHQALRWGGLATRTSGENGLQYRDPPMPRRN